MSGNNFNGDLYQIAAQELAEKSKNASTASAASGYSWYAAAASTPAPAPAPMQAPIQSGWGFDFSKPQYTDSFVWKGQGPAPALTPAPVYASPFNFGYGSLNSLKLEPTRTF